MGNARGTWLAGLPAAIAHVQSQWSLSLDQPGATNLGSCSWIAPVTTPDGTQAVLKLGMPHMEAEHEADGLRFWNGDPTIRLIDFDKRFDALLLERCLPGTPLTVLPETEQDVVIAGLLRRLWRSPESSLPFRPLSVMLEYWRDEALASVNPGSDLGLVREGLSLFAELPRTAASIVLLATDLHAGNVLRSTREPWLAIDPKPFLGDPAYDATQHLFNCSARLCSNPDRTVKRFADLLAVDHERVRLWTFARAAVESNSQEADSSSTGIAQVLR